jgi:hypothetical protein
MHYTLNTTLQKQKAKDYSIATAAAAAIASPRPAPTRFPAPAMGDGLPVEAPVVLGAPLGAVPTGLVGRVPLEAG